MFKNLLFTYMAPEEEGAGGGGEAAGGDAGGEQSTALDAINEVLGVSDEPGEAGEAGEGGTDEGAEGDAGEGDEASATGDEGEGGEEGEKPAADETSERDPVTGKFKKKDAAAADAAAKDGAKKGEAAAAKPADALNDPIPKDLAPKTQERIRTLIKTAKEVTAERDAVRNDFDFMVQGVQSTGATPQQYGETLSWLALFNSNDPTQQEKALELVETVADRLATMLGKERNVSDILSAHPDLKEAVAKNQVTLKHAKELATMRNQNKFKQEISTAAQNEQTREQQAAQELQTARTSLNTLENNLKATDPQYEAKKAQIVPILKPLFKAIPPSNWAAAFQEAYKNARVAAPAPRSATPRVPNNQPLRGGKNPAGGAAAGPTSALDAMSAALENMGK